MPEILTKSNSNIPDWLKSHIQHSCKFCGAPIMDSGPLKSDGSGDIVLTQRYCVNTYCIGHLGRRIVKLAGMFNIQGIGDATARSLALEYGIKSHMEIIPKWFKEKPKVHLWQVGAAAQIYGFENKWKDILDGYGSFTEYLEDDSIFREPVVIANKDYLVWCEQFFSINKPLSKHVLRVMLSGSMDGFRSKEEFIKYLNGYAGSIIQVREVGKRKSNVDFLIKEPYSVDHSKTAVALEAGIPILSSQEFMYVLLSMAKKIMNKNNSS